MPVDGRGPTVERGGDWAQLEGGAVAWLQPAMEQLAEDVSQLELERGPPKDYGLRALIRTRNSSTP